MALQSDGKIVALRSDFHVARFNPNGTLDGSFATGGVNPELFANSRGERLLVAPDGRIVICGTTMPGNESSQIVVAQLTSAGLLDKSFRGSGKTAIEIAGGHDSGLAMALQSDGKILIGGMTSPLKAAQVKRDLALARLLPNGFPDPTFGMQGVVVHL